MLLSKDLFQVLIGISALSQTLVSATPYHDYHTHFNRHPSISTFDSRDYVTPEQRRDSYDFIIAGGGLAGLVLASRLSDNASTTVLVLEAGPTGDDVRTRINTPSTTYFQSLLYAPPYDWMYTTVPQSGTGNRAMAQPRGRVLGGSSAVNGMYMVRPPSAQVNAWRDLIAPNDAAAADVWGWDKFFTALKKTESFTAPTDDSEKTAGMKYQASSHGTSGNLHVTYPGYMVPVTGSWLPSLAAAGVSISEDAYSGDNLGGFFCTSSENPSNWTRSYSKSAYIDVLPARPNLHIIAEATVERIVFSDNLVSGNRVATGVQFSNGAGTTVQSVTANKEVILAGGAMGSPHILLVSGVGPTDVLNAANVAVKAELPGVGQHLIDHLSTGVSWEAKVDTQGSITASGSDLSKTPEFNSFINSGIAYVNGSLLFGGTDSFNTFMSGIESSETSAATLVPSKDQTVIDGYKAIYDTTMKEAYPATGLLEILLSINAANNIAVQVANQQPLSAGRIYINSSSIYDQPLIDPQYFSHPADITVMRQGIKFARQIGATAPLNAALGAEVTPGPTVQTDADIEAWLRTVVGTEFHPGGSCAMLPLDKGGVVDAKLKVYGTTNVRVIDSSVFPVSFSAHLMAPTYGLAEVGAQIILDAYSPTASTTTTSGNSASTSTGGNSAATTSKASSGITTVAATGAFHWLAGLVLPFVASALFL
ncbi:mala s 12 allergen [Pholiota conissans]|uniref:pyranose dehydrogenase (acceptor) n=1 Tax=Pholiota conissans TaxID=109636 RepID=A0A9P6CYX5_9AGAR|nr:mala s 12 allergen [Pholiota conissans]